MKFSNNGIAILKTLEGTVKIGDKHIIYDDKSGNPIVVNGPLPHGATIGYGHLIKRGENFANGIPESVATAILRSDVAIAERAVNDNILVPITQNQFDALVMLAYNIGAANFAASTVVKYINNQNFHSSIYPNLESAWKAWNRSGGKVSTGLTNRRDKEWAVYNSVDFTHNL